VDRLGTDEGWLEGAEEAEGRYEGWLDGLVDTVGDSVGCGVGSGSPGEGGGPPHTMSSSVVPPYTPLHT